jgi:glutathione-specific gamma-glutamylcyclotransferase
VYGVGYAISKEDAPSVEQYLDYREKDAYLKRYVSLFDSSSGALVTSKCIVYVGMAEAHLDQSENPEHVARIIASRSGPSGTNTEYALMLQNALVREGMHDDHVSAVVHWLYHI